MTLYDEMQQLTREILSDPDFKQGVTQLVSVTPGTGSVDEPGDPTETLHDIDGTVRGVSQRFVVLGLAVATDFQITHSVLADGPDPKINDFVIMDGQRFKVMQVVKNPAAGTVVSFTLILRK